MEVSLSLSILANLAIFVAVAIALSGPENKMRMAARLEAWALEQRAMMQERTRLAKQRRSDQAAIEKRHEEVLAEVGR